MNRLAIRILNKARRIASKVDGSEEDGPALPSDCSGQAASDLIREKLLAAEPCMITRFGRTELRTILRRWNRTKRSFLRNIWRYVQGKQGPFWWDDEINQAIRDLSGFFPCTPKALDRFADQFLRDIAQVDVLGAWYPGEAALASRFPRARIVPLQDLEPFSHKDPWTTALKSRSVLVIHPFAESIHKQYEKRAMLFADPRMLPNFTLKTLRAVQSLGGNGGGFGTWFDALDWMCKEVRQIEFDIALIGAGAYGLPLAAFIKGMGKKAVHLGGATQILFGIKGRRWEQWPFYQNLFNEHWIRPLPEETPDSYQAIESGCYW